LGDELIVQVAAVKLEERKVDFELIESKTSKTPRLSQKELKMRDQKSPAKTGAKKSKNKHGKQKPKGHRKGKR